MMNGGVYPVPFGRTVRGRLRLPASKSVTQRYLALALAGRLSLDLEHPLDAEDPRLFLAALRVLGFTVEEQPGRLCLRPPGPRSADPRRREIFCGNGGTMCRILTAVLCTVPGRFRLDGVARLRQRPIGPLVDALGQLGAVLRFTGVPGYPPLEIDGGTLGGGRARLDAGASSQFLSALLIAGQAARAPIEIAVEALASSPYVDLTLETIRERGGVVEMADGGRRFATRPSSLMAGSVEIEGDFSAAAYPAAAAALAGGRVELEGLHRSSVQGDRGLLAILVAMGAAVQWQGDRLVVAGATRLRALDVDLSGMPDQVPTIAALAPFAAGRTRISGVAHLRIKESDRLAAMARELGRLGVPVLERPDGLEIEGVWAGGSGSGPPVTVDTHGDHRIAMALAIVGLRRPGVSIAAPQVVGKSYPGFWDHLARLVGS